VKADAIKRLKELQEKRRDMVSKQIQQQKRLIARLETDKSLGAEDRKVIMQSIKKLSAMIEAAQPSPKSSAAPPASKQATSGVADGSRPRYALPPSPPSFSPLPP